MAAEGNLSEEAARRFWIFWMAGETRAPRLVLRLAAEKMTEKDRRWLLKPSL